MHIHIGALHALITFLNVIIVGVFWRLATFHMRNTALGQAMAVAY